MTNKQYKEVKNCVVVVDKVRRFTLTLINIYI